VACLNEKIARLEKERDDLIALSNSLEESKTSQKLKPGSISLPPVIVQDIMDFLCPGNVYFFLLSKKHWTNS
jgi:hypothetical protein